MSQKQGSRYGFFNHFIISPQQKETAERYDLEINVMKGGAFEITSKHGKDALVKLAKPFARDIELYDSLILQRKNMKKFLNFLRQPIAGSLENEDRMAGHAVTRFLTTGHVKIERFLDEGLASAASLECHLKGENKMKENDIWEKEPEFWNPEMSAQKVSSIPGTSYDPERGFVLELDEAMTLRLADLKPAQKALRDGLQKLLTNITGAPIEEGQKDLALSAEQLQDFYQTITKEPELQRLIKAARVEEKTSSKLKSILENASELKTDARFQIAAATKDTGTPNALKFDNLMQATSALSPIVGSDVMYETWKNSHSTEYWMNLSDPVNEVQEEFQVFASVIREMRRQEDIDPEHMQALIHNFRPMIAFAADLMESMSEGADHKKVAKALDENARSEFQNNIQTLSKAFESASVNGVSAGDLDGDYDELLTSVGNVLGQNGSMAKQQLMGYVDMMKGFWQGVGESAFDSPWVAGMLVGFVGYAWYTKYGVDATLAQQSAEMVFSGVNGGAWGDPSVGTQDFQVPQDFLDSFSSTSREVIDEAVQTGEVDTCLVDTSCHYNYVVPPFMVDLIDDSVGQYLKFRHYVGSDIIASNANTAVNILPSAIEATFSAADISVNHNTVFRGVLEDVTTQGGLFVVDANMFQDGSHASMLAYGITRASKNGFGAFRGMGGLAAEFFNPATRIIKTATSPLSRLSVNIGQTFGLVGAERADKVRRNAKPQFESRIIASSMDKISGAASKILLKDVPEAENTLSTDAENIALNIGWYGLKREKIGISDSMINDLEQRLNEFALVLKYSADDIGIESEPYTEFVLETLERVEQSIKDYKASSDPDRLQTLKKDLNGDLQHVVGAELKFNGRTAIYDTLFPNAGEERQRKTWIGRALHKIFGESAETKNDRRHHVLARHASKKEGRMMRSEFHQDMAEQRRNAQNRFQKPEKLLSLQPLKYAWGEAGRFGAKAKYTAAQGLNGLWGATVFAAREGIQEPFNQIPAKKRLATAFGLACLGGLGADIAGFNNAITNAFSATGATLSGITATGLIAGAINIPQDLALHTAAIGVSAAAVGLPWYLAVNKGVKPLWQGTTEKIGIHRGPSL